MADGAMAKTNFTEADGHQLAADMLREIHAHWLARQQDVPDEQIRDLWRRDDSSILRRYLATVIEPRSAELEQGFFAVLTDYIGSAPEGTPDPDCYEPKPEARHE